MVKYTIKQRFSTKVRLTLTKSENNTISTKNGIISTISSGNTAFTTIDNNNSYNTDINDITDSTNSTNSAISTITAATQQPPPAASSRWATPRKGRLFSSSPDSFYF